MTSAIRIDSTGSNNSDGHPTHEVDQAVYVEDIAVERTRDVLSESPQKKATVVRSETICVCRLIDLRASVWSSKSE